MPDDKPSYADLEKKIENLQWRLKVRSDLLEAEKGKYEDQKRLYNDLYKSCRVIMPHYALVHHLEKQIEIRQRVIEQYQEHYQKFSHFYADFLKGKKKKISTPKEF
jgi:hypothetical protein